MADVVSTEGHLGGDVVWKKKYDELGVTEQRYMKQLREENRRLKRLMADLTLDRHILQEVITERPARRREICTLDPRAVPGQQEAFVSVGTAAPIDFLLTSYCQIWCTGADQAAALLV